MNQDLNNQNYNPSNNNGSKSDQQQNFNTPNPVHFSPGSVNLDALYSKSQNVNNVNNFGQPAGNFTNSFDQLPPTQNQYSPIDQLSGYNPYQNTGSNIQNLQNFTPQDNFDTGFGNQRFENTNNFNQNGIDQYKSSTPQFNANDPYLMPSTNPENDDLDESEINPLQKPQRDTKKILMFGLIGLIVVLLVASIALYFLSQGNKSPATNLPANSNTNKPINQSIPPSNNSQNSASSTDSTNTTDTNSKTGNANTPASKSIINPGATIIPSEWLINNFKAKSALNEDGSCKLQNICGAKSDPDKDGLSNLDEYIYGTNPSIADTDGDGISDKDELFVYHTDPKNVDTNGNSYKDGIEISNCYDPNIPSQKLSKARLNEISSNVNKPFVNGLSSATQSTLKAAGATVGELEKGYLTKCAITSTGGLAPKTTNEKKTTNTSQVKIDLPTDENSNTGS